MESGNLFAFPQRGAAVALLVDGTSTPWIDRRPPTKLVATATSREGSKN